MDPIQAFLQNMQAQGASGGGQVSTQPQDMGGPGWVNPAELQGGAMPGPLAAGAAGSPYWKALLAAAGIMQPTPTAANDQAPTDAWFQKPSGVGAPAATPPMPARPFTPTPIVTPQLSASPSAAQPARPVTPTPVASTKKRIDPASVDLGKSRFGTVQYQVPNSTRNAPIYTALNLGGSS